MSLLVFSSASFLCDQDEAVIKASWIAQMQKGKERPNLVHWRDELVSITKDSTEDLEDTAMSVELMRVRCDVCYHEKSVSISFCRFAIVVSIFVSCQKRSTAKNIISSNLSQENVLLAEYRRLL